MRVGHSQQIFAAEPTPYVATRMGLAILRLELREEEGGEHTHSVRPRI